MGLCGTAMYLCLLWDKERIDKFQERVNVQVEAAEGYGCEFGADKTLWDTDPICQSLTAAEKVLADNIREVKERCHDTLLGYGFYQALNGKFDKYKKDLKASYAQGNNKYETTVVGSYQMALDVMSVYQKLSTWRSRKNSGNDK